MPKKKRKIKKSFKKFLIFLVLLIVTLCFISHYKELNKAKMIEKAKVSEQIVKKEREKKYQTCVMKDDLDLKDLSNDKIMALNDALQSYDVFVKYEDLSTGFSYGYKENEVLYGASLIKLVDAIYLLDHDVDLSITKPYLEKYKRHYSDGMEKEKLGKELSLKILMNYAISVSDNSAHMMLIDYIGEEALKEYGKSLGALHTLEGSDKYGNQSASDASIYLKRAYQLISEKEDGKYLKEAMINDYKNYLPLDSNMIVAHKYGSYDKYFHDIGIVYGEHDYSISILTTAGKSNYQDTIKNVHKLVNELHETYWQYRSEYCREKVYK